MRIFIYSMNYAPELVGTGKYTGEMAEWLAKNNYDVFVVSASPYYPEWKIHSDYQSWQYKKEKKQGITIIRCPVWVPRKPTGFKRFLHLISFAISSLPIAIGQVFRRPDVVLVVEPAIACLPGALFVSWINRSNIWLHIQDFEIDAGFDLGMLRSPLVRKLFTRLERWLMSRVDAISTISYQMINRLKEKGVMNGIFFPNWVETDHIYPVNGKNIYREKLCIGTSDVVCLYSGNFGVKQGLEIIIDAAKRLADNKNIVFVMCGQGAAYPRLRELSEGMENIRWLPLQPAEQLNELLNVADVHLLPQRANAAELVMPSKLTGMMASGRAILAIADKNTEIANFLADRGLVVSPGNESEFVGALKRLVDDPGLREGFGRAAREYAVQHLEKEVILREFEKQLRSLALG